MWNGPRSGPRGGPAFGGNPRGDMFEARDGPMPDFRGRDGMNVGPRPQERPPMDMRRFDGPPDMRGHDMDPNNMDLRGRDGPRDFFRQGEEPDLNLRRRYEMEIRGKLQNVGGFPGQGRHQMETGGRDMPGGNMRDGRFMDARERERMAMDVPGFNPMDQRRRHPGEPMGRNDSFRDMQNRDRPQMGVDDIDGLRMDMPQPDRGMVDFERRGGMHQMNNRGRFESDMDMRNRMGPSGEFRDRDRDRSPGRFGDKDRMPMEGRGRPDMPSDPNRPSFRPGETLRDREFPEQLDGSVAFRGRENESLPDDWRNNNAKDRDSFPGMMNRRPPFPRETQPERFFAGRGREGRGEPFMDRDRRPEEVPGRDGKGPENFPGRDPPKGGPAQTFPPVNPALIGPIGDKDGKPWSREPDIQLDRSAQNLGRPPYTQDKSQMPPQENRFPNDRIPFKGSKDIPQPSLGRGILGPCPEGMQRNSGADRRDQDYRDIDYRTGSGRAYDYNLSDLSGPEKDRKEPRLAPPQRPSNAGSQDQDYRSASVKDKVSNTISISGIPKTATMEQILGAFAVRDGVPMQGMKIKNVVPGYSFDMAYVEFLNLEDAVHFMESNQGSMKVGATTALMKYVQPDRSAKEAKLQEPPRKPPQVPDAPTQPRPSPQPKVTPKQDETRPKPPPVDPASKTAWQRNSDLTPEAWQQQVDQQLQQQEAEQQAEAWASRNASRHPPRDLDPVFKESKTMIIKNLKNTTTVEMILKALDPYAYLDERNVRLVRGKPPGCKCFCFVDMDSHEQVTRLVDMLTRPRPLMLDGVRIYAEVAKPLKNQNSYKRDYDKSGSSILGYPPEVLEQQQQMQQQQQHQQQQQQQQQHQQQQHFYQPQPLPLHAPMAAVPGGQGDMVLPGSRDTPQTAATAMVPHAVGYTDAPAPEHPYQATNPASATAAGPVAQGTPSQHTDPYSYGSDTPDLSAYLYDATSGFYYDPQTTLYYDPSSRYFYNAETQQYLYWDGASKTYIPVTGSTTDGQASNPVPALPGEISIPSALASTSASDGTAMPPADENGRAMDAADKREDGESGLRSEKKEKEKEDKPRSLAAFKIMKDMERWAKIQNRQKDSVRSPSPVLKTPGGADDHRTSKAADAAFAIFERKVGGGDDLFKKPLAPPKREDKGSKRPMGSLGLLAADYGAGSDDEEEEKHEQPMPSRSPQDEKEDKLTDWKKMACLLCRRQFPSKDALIRHQQLSDLHKQNMEIHLKIKRSKKELEALENQEKEVRSMSLNSNALISRTEPQAAGSKLNTRASPEMKRRKYQHPHQNSWAGGSRDSHKLSERPGLGSEPQEPRKKDSAVWDHATYKQAVRKAMFARFKELD